MDIDQVIGYLDCDLLRARRSHIQIMQDTVKVLGFILQDVSQETATTLRDPNDGARGWTVVEVVCHLRDYDHIFRDRVCLMLSETYPMLPGFDHERLAVERAYNRQELRQVYAELVASRQEFVALFGSLEEEQWQRSGVHPERGRFTMYDALFQVGGHDALHMEQIARILGER